MEGFQAEDRHNPLPHIALLTTALKSAYRNTASLSTELRELLISAGREWRAPELLFFACGRGGLREVCYRAKAVHSRSADRRIVRAAVALAMARATISRGYASSARWNTSSATVT
jgi:hypothetical protein